MNPNDTPADGGPPQLTLHDGRATITLNRPAHHNRLHVEDLLALQQHIAMLQADASVRLLVLTGRGRSFCSGFHLGDFDRQPDAPGAGPRLFEETVDALEALAVPSICRLNGSVFGGATDLALACDFRVGVAGMQLRMPAARLGLHYYPSGLQRYVSRFGVSATKRAFLTARPFSMAQLQALGLFEAVSDAASWDATLEALVLDVLALAPLAVQETKRSINEIACGDYNAQRLREREHMSCASADFAEGRTAFAERRKPVFTGR